MINTFVVISLICGIIIIGYGLHAIVKETPISNFLGNVIKSEEVSNIKAYNKECGTMWIVFGMPFIIAGIMEILTIKYIPMIIFIIGAFPGSIIFAIVYFRIRNKYITSLKK